MNCRNTILFENFRALKRRGIASWTVYDDVCISLLFIIINICTPPDYITIHRQIQYALHCLISIIFLITLIMYVHAQIFCNTRKSVLLTAETLSREITITFSPDQQAKLTALASTIKNKKLQVISCIIIWQSISFQNQLSIEFSQVLFYCYAT